MAHTVVYKFTSSSSDDWNNDSDFAQQIIRSGYSSHAKGFADIGDSDTPTSAFNDMKSAVTTILDAATFSDFSAADQVLYRTTVWDSQEQWSNYRNELAKLDVEGPFRNVDYIRRLIRHSGSEDSDGNNWGA